MEWQDLFVGREEARKQLHDAYRDAKPGEPQVIALVAETGWGKTRLIQDFYEWLILHEQPSESSFWPKKLANQQDITAARRTIVHPLPEQMGHKPEAPTLLWLGLQSQMNLERSEVGSILSNIQPVLKPLIYKRLKTANQEERQEILKELGYDAAVEVADTSAVIAEAILGEVPILREVLTGGKILNAIRKYARARQQSNEFRQQVESQIGVSPHEEARREADDDVKMSLDLILEFFRDDIPVVLVMDDAQWAHPQTVRFIQRAHHLSMQMRGRLLIIAGYWRGDWQTQSPLMTGTIEDTTTFASWAKSIRATPIELESEPRLVEVVTAAFPSLSIPDSEWFVEKALYQPLFVQQLILRAMKHEAAWFTPDGLALSKTGRQQIIDTPTLGELCRKRFDELEGSIQRVLGWGSIQGHAFLHRLTRHLATDPAISPHLEHDPAIQQAYQSAVASPRRIIDGSRFDQVDFYTLAKQFLIDDGEECLIRTAIDREVIDIVKTGEYRNLPIAERMDLARVVRELLPLDETIDIANERHLSWAAVTVDLALLEAKNYNWFSADHLLREVASHLPTDQALPTEWVALWDQIESTRLLGQQHAYSYVLRWVEPLLNIPQDIRDKSILLNIMGDAMFSLGETVPALKLYRECNATLERIEKEFGENPQSMRDVSVSQSKVADALRALGEGDQALKLFQGSLATREQIVKEFGENPESMRDVSVSQSKVADVLLILGERDQALKLYRECNATLERIVKEFGNNPQSMREVSLSQIKVADVLLTLGETDQALNLFQDSLAARERIVKGFGENPESMRDVSVCQNRVAEVLLALGKRDQALKLYRECNATLERIVKEFGNNPQSMRDVSISQSNVADVLLALGVVDLALTLFQASLATSEQIVKEFGNNPQSMRDVSISQIKVADVLLTLGETDQALKLFQASLATSEQIVKEFGENPQGMRDVTVSQVRVADVLLVLGEVDLALKLFQASLATSEQIVKEFGNNPQSMRDVSISQIKVADVLLTLGETDQALKLFQASLATSEQIVKEFGENPQGMRDVSVSQVRVADVLLVLGEVDLAMKLFQAGLATGERIVKEFGETPESMRDVSFSQNRVAEVLLALGETDQALKLYRECNATSERILNEFGETPESMRDVLAIQQKIAEVFITLGDATQALTQFQASLDTSERIVNEFGENPQSMRDLAMTLVKTSFLYLVLSKRAEACRWALKAEPIFARILSRYGSTPQAIQDLANIRNLIQDVSS